MGDLIYGLIGRKLGHSWSAPIHRMLGCDSYRLIELEPEELSSFMKRGDLGAVNVTIPYKRDVMEFCDVIDETAAAVGSVNTVVRKSDGRLYAYNTDIAGFRYMADTAGISLEGKKVVILGSGGTSLTAQAAARQMNAGEIIVISRSGKDNYENINSHADAEVIVNATPVGMYPNNLISPVDLSLFPWCVGVLDVIYNPRRTALLLQAKSLGIRHTDGLPMLAAQAVEAEKHFFGRDIPECEIPPIVSRLRRDMTNIVLIGMPGCGKTTVGECLSEITGREAIDIDRVIEARIGMTIPEYFEKFGEESFRKVEKEDVEAVGKLSGKIILTGGGVVKDFGNYAPLHQNGRIYHLLRPIGELPTEGRPLSRGADLSAMWAERKPLYEYFRDTSVENRTTPEDAANLIWRDFCENTCN